jgi:hypothetical protein
LRRPLVSWLAKFKHPETKNLIDKGAKLNVKDRNGITTIDYLFNTGQLDIIPKNKIEHLITNDMLYVAVNCNEIAKVKYILCSRK